MDDDDAPLYSVGQVADMLDVHQAYLRRLDDQRVVVPSRSPGGQRRYSRHQIGRVQRVTDLTGEGLTVAGARRVLALEDRVAELQAAERDPARTGAVR
ncbi:MAG: MerR family transcriptional regulator [Acidimicrobiales bacterium]